MNEKLEKAKNAIKRNAPVIIATASVTALVVIVYSRKGNGAWNNLVLNKEALAFLTANEDHTIVFEGAKAMISGRPWNPALDK